MRNAVPMFVVLSVLASSVGCGKGQKEEAAAASGTVAVNAGEDGFVPSAVSFPKGAPAKLVFTRTSDATCATEVVFPELGVKKELPKGQPVTVDIPTDKEQKLAFQCGMGMYKSSVVIKAN